MRLAPWMALSRSPDGSFQLLARSGTNQLVLSDLTTGDVAAVGLDVPLAPGVLNTAITANVSGLGVVSVSPADNATDVSRVTAVTVTFNRPLNPAGLLDHAFQLVGTNGQPVTASLALNLAGTVATLLPATPLEAAQRYLVVLSTNLSDPLGRTLEGPNTFAFTTVALPVRDSSAQLVIYEPGATNVPAAILARIPGYVPGTNRTAIVVRGTPGVADPKVAVILANESSGETATVLSLADGSFASVIGGTEEDFVSATFVNLNGTRVYIPVSRQLFDNGFVGLYRTGGILEAQSDGGPVQVFIQPEAVPTRTKFWLNPITPAQLKEQLGGVEPDLAQVAGGALTLEAVGPAPTGGIRVSMPVNLLSLGYPNTEPATNAALALAVVSDEQGVKTFEVLDRMTFTPKASPGADAAPRRTGLALPRSNPGKRPARPADEDLYNGAMDALVQLAPFAGIADPLFKYVFVPLFLGTKPVVVRGRVGAVPAEVNIGANAAQGAIGLGGQVANGPVALALQAGGLGVSQLQRLAAKSLPGAFIILRRLPNVTLTRPGRLEPGMIHATSGSDGRYLMVSPSAISCTAKTPLP